MSGERPPPRQVTLVLCDAAGAVLGALPPFRVEVPWWQEAGPVVRAARADHGVDVVVLRLLAPGSGYPAGGDVTYLAELRGPLPPSPALAPWPHPLDEHPLRQSYARPGGPALDLAWADEVLVARSTPRTGPAEQVRTWNLSSIWRLPTERSAAWLKAVPPFFAHEGGMLQRLDPAVVPPLFAADGTRMLLGDVPGDDLYGAPFDRLLPMMRSLVALQAAWVERVNELLSLGAPDWRAEPFAAAAQDVLRRTPEIESAVTDTVSRFIDDLPRRFAAVEACGVPDTLVHGDFHAGNVRGAGERLVLLDWGDCGVGNPLLDVPAFVERRPADEQQRARDAFVAAWAEAVPGCDAARAARLVAPIAAVRQAIIYRGFLDRIEPSEHVYHRDDPAAWLRTAADLLVPR